MDFLMCLDLLQESKKFAVTKYLFFDLDAEAHTVGQNVSCRSVTYLLRKIENIDYC